MDCTVPRQRLKRTAFVLASSTMKDEDNIIEIDNIMESTKKVGLSMACPAFVLVKCKKCRNPLVNTKDSRIISGHEVVLSSENDFRPNDGSGCSDTNNALYLMEQTLPDWMIAQIDKDEWIKGRLNCTKCQARLGSFDFVSGRKCACGQYVVPPIHLIKTKLDFSVSKDNKPNVT